MNKLKFNIQKRDLVLFLIASALIGAAAAVDSTSLSNRLYDVLKLNVLERSILEIPREIPGLIIIAIYGFLCSFSDRRVSAIANILAGLGMLLFGIFGNTYLPVVITICIYSLGFHMYMPLANSLSLSFAKEGAMGKRIGQVQGVNSAALIISAAILYALYQFLHLSYLAAYLAGAICLILAGILFLMMSPVKMPRKRYKIHFKKEYKLYYILSLVNGARGQLTYTFGPWLLIDTFKQPVTTITLLFFIVSAINVFFKPFLGMLIDKKGERFVMTAEAIILFVLSFGFAFAKSVFPSGTALVIVGVCYVIDNAILSVSMARATYIKKIAVTPEDVTPVMFMGTSLNHVFTVTLPLLAGVVWLSSGESGYIYVFMCGAVISVANVLLASRIRLPGKGTAAAEAVELTDSCCEEI